MKSVLRYILLALGIIWALPVTIMGFLFHVGPMWLVGCYELVGIRGYALVWALKKDAPIEWVKKAWKGWAGNAIGNIITLREHPDAWASSKTMTHELQHVEQCMRLGVIQPIMYALIYATAKIGCPNTHPYYDCVFEIDARRKAGQLIDVVGAISGKK